MTTALITHRIADYEAWRPEFDRAMESDWTGDIRSYQVLRSTTSTRSVPGNADASGRDAAGCDEGRVRDGHLLGEESLDGLRVAADLALRRLGVA